MKAVPGFLQVSDLGRWLITSAVTLISITARQIIRTLNKKVSEMTRGGAKSYRLDRTNIKRALCGTHSETANTYRVGSVACAT
eukprot:6491212-Amphidinium_carterae.5